MPRENIILAGIGHFAPDPVIQGIYNNSRVRPGGEWVALLSPSLEDYLEEIFRISQSGATIRVTDIAACLKVSLPSVTSALKKLSEGSYIKYRPYRDILLTEKGKELGKFLVERNSIIQEFLNLIDSRCNVAAEAEAMEHYLSLPTLEAIINFVRFTEKNPIWLQEYKIFVKNNSRA